MTEDQMNLKVRVLQAKKLLLDYEFNREKYVEQLRDHDDMILEHRAHIDSLMKELPKN